MTAPSDLTRWNQAGLDRFRYVHGNAAVYFDRLQSLLRSVPAFEVWEAIQPGAEAPAETLSEEHRRVLEQYHGARGDLGLEIGRSFARALHVLTEHLNADANEGYLGTATQWNNVRRLVAMLDYHPAPPASASTPLVLIVKPGKRGMVARGLQVKHTPEEGGSPVVFETLADLDVDAELNELRLRGHDRNPDPLVGDEIEIAEVVEDLRIGDPVVLEREDTGELQTRLIDGVQLHRETTTVHLENRIARGLGFTKGHTLVHLKPADRLAPIGPIEKHLSSPEIGLHLKVPATGLRRGDIVYINDGAIEYFRTVVHVEGRFLRFDEPISSLDLSHAYVSRARVLAVTSVTGRRTGDGHIIAVRVAGDLSYLQETTIADKVTPRRPITGMRQPILHTFEVDAAVYAPIDPDFPEQGGYTTLKVLDAERLLSNPQSIYVKPVGRDFDVDSHLESARDRPFSRTLITEAPRKAGIGSVVVVVRGRQYVWGRLSNVVVADDTGLGRLTVPTWFDRGLARYYTADTQVLTGFKHRARVTAWNRNQRSLTGRAIELANPIAVKRGRMVYLGTQSNAPGLLATVVDVLDGELVLDTDLDGSGLQIGNTVLRGNVVMAGHGETKPQKVLGAGIATRSGQTFVLDTAGISFVADATQTTGVRADIEITVEDRAWKQVPTLNDSGPTDAHYTVRMTEDGFLEIGFGDGLHGRRLPGGANNVRVRARVGTGLEGNVPAGSFKKLAKAHALIDAVEQPLNATGANHMEDIESLKSNAPATVLTLERAVSLPDFAHLAASHSSVWQAKGFVRRGEGRLELVDVIVVPADGVVLAESKRKELQSFLQQHAVPQIRVRVEEFQRAPVAIDVTVRIDRAQYDLDQVRDMVNAALVDAFSLRRRGIGEPLYLSAVYQAVEQVPGVSSSTCRMRMVEQEVDQETVARREPSTADAQPARRIMVLRPTNPAQVLFVDRRNPALTITTEGIEP